MAPGAPEALARERRLFPGVLRSLGLLAAAASLQVLLYFVLRPVARLGGEWRAFPLLASMLAAYATVIAAFLWRRGLRLRALVQPEGRAPRAAVLVACSALVLAPGLFLVAALLQDLLAQLLPVSEALRARFVEFGQGGVAALVVAAIAGPLLEELLFRGIVLRGLASRMPPGAAIVVSALMFGLAHLNWRQGLNAAMLGLPLGWLYLRFRWLAPCMLLHMGYNGLVLAAALADLPVSARAMALGLWTAGLVAACAGVLLVRALPAPLRQSGDDDRS